MTLIRKMLKSVTLMAMLSCVPPVLVANVVLCVEVTFASPFAAATSLVEAVRTFVKLYSASVVDPAVDPRLIETGLGVGAAVVSVEAVSPEVRVGLPMLVMLLTILQVARPLVVAVSAVLLAVSAVLLTVLTWVCKLLLVRTVVPILSPVPSKAAKNPGSIVLANCRDPMKLSKYDLGAGECHSDAYC